MSTYQCVVDVESSSEQWVLNLQSTAGGHRGWTLSRSPRLTMAVSLQLVVLAAVLALHGTRANPTQALRDASHESIIEAAVREACTLNPQRSCSSNNLLCCLTIPTRPDSSGRAPHYCADQW